MKGESSMGILTERQEKLLSLFKAAIASEKEAQETYRTMLSYSDDPAIKQIIEMLLSEERQHEEKLFELYDGLRTTPEFKDTNR
jgi:rubrerythrin